MNDDFTLADLGDIIIPEESVEEPGEPVIEELDEPTIEEIIPPVEDPKVDVDLSDEEGDPIDADVQKPNELYSTLAEALKEQGFFNNLEDVSEIKDLDSLSNAFKDEVKKNEYNDLTERQREVLTAFRDGIPEAVVVEHQTNMEQYSQITPEMVKDNGELQKALFVTDLTNKGITEARANKMYEISYDTGESYDEAIASLETLKQREVANYQSKVNEAKRRDDIKKQVTLDKENAIKKSIYGVDKFMGDVAISQNLKEKVHNSITSIVGYTDSGEPYNELMKSRMDDPINFETNLYYLFELTNGFKNIKKFTKQADSKAARKLETLISNNTFVDTQSSSTYKPDPESSDPGSIVTLI